MPAQDRTSEFSSTVKSIQERTQGFQRPPTSKARMTNEEWTAFRGYAKKIGSDLANTCLKLEKLTMLAKRKALFNDKPLEIQELTPIIKEDLANLNKSIAQLQNLSTFAKSSKTKQLGSHSNSVVVGLQSKLAHMSKDFKDVLEERNQNLKIQKSRREQFSRPALTSSFPTTQERSSLLYDQEQSRGDHVVSMNHDQLLLTIDEQDSIIEERVNLMQTINSSIAEMGAIFQQLAHLVQFQGESIQRIDANVEDASLNIEQAHSEILRYFNSVSSNRWLIIKVFGVLIIFFIIFIVVAGF